MKCSGCLIGFFLLGMLCLNAQTNPYHSGGPLTQEQAAYDVRFYDLRLEVMPDRERIKGRLQMDARIVHPMDVLVINLGSSRSACASRTCRSSP